MAQAADAGDEHHGGRAVAGEMNCVMAGAADDWLVRIAQAFDGFAYCIDAGRVERRGRAQPVAVDLNFKPRLVATWSMSARALASMSAMAASSWWRRSRVNATWPGMVFREERAICS